MKKIVTIMTVAAMATSLFAADVAAKVKLNGSLFNIAGGNVSALSIDTNHPEHWNPVIGLSTSSDLAGASVNFYVADEKTGIDGWNSGWTIVGKGWNVWCKPADWVKFTLGSAAANLNQETIDWSKSISGLESIGYAANITAGSFTFDILTNEGWGKKYLTAPKGGKLSLAETYIKGQTGGDWGTVNACVDFSVVNGKIGNLWFGEGYKTTVGGVTMFENVLVNMKEGKYTSTSVELFASGNAGGVNMATFLRPALDKDNKFSMFGTAKVSYTIGAYTPYLYVICEDWAANTKAKDGIIVKPGVTTSIGACAFEGAVEVKITDKVVVDVPVNFAVAF